MGADFHGPPPLETAGPLTLCESPQSGGLRLVDQALEPFGPLMTTDDAVTDEILTEALANDPCCAQAPRRTDEMRRLGLLSSPHVRRVPLSWGGARELLPSRRLHQHQAVCYSPCQSAALNFEASQRALTSGHRPGEVAASIIPEEQRAPEIPPLGNLCLVFTDIVESTRLWETEPEAMKRAMVMHNELIEKSAPTFQGYEVKFNGDGYMIAFPSASSALSWCLVMQKEFLKIDWPEQILSSRLASEIKDKDGKLVFRGPKIRMSIHWGAPIAKMDEVTHRMDYMGPMVNRSARSMQVTAGGQIVVSQAYLDELERETNTQNGGSSGSSNTSFSTSARSVAYPRSNDESVVTTAPLDGPPSSNVVHEDFEIQNLGEFRLKGLADPVQLYYIVPTSLRGRIEYYLPTSDSAASRIGAALKYIGLNFKTNGV